MTSPHTSDTADTIGLQSASTGGTDANESPVSVYESVMRDTLGEHIWYASASTYAN